jgi:ABC-type branched-subunit amino acid transport system ATPase component
MSAIIAAQGLVAGYKGRRVLNGVSLRADPAEIILLIGPNGCGKTTLLKVLAGVLEPEEGHVFLRGEDVSRTMEYQRARMRLGYLTQTRNTFPSLTVDENLRLSFWRQGGDYSEKRDSILSLFPMLKSILDRRAGLLSGGERQALAISMVLMRPVDILLLDEPTAGLSPLAAASILTAIREAHLKTKFSVVIVEHNLGLVHRWVSRVLVMAEGRIAAEEHNPSVLLDPNKLQEYYFG